MAYGTACQSADLIAGIASVSGRTFLDPSRCQPAQAVNILDIDGTADTVVPYGGGAFTLALGGPENTAQFPGALQTIWMWAGYNGASGPVTDPAPSMDLIRDVSGPDTVVTRYTNAPPDGAVELWSIQGAEHAGYWTPTLEFSPRVIDWLLAHPKP
jgi:polyhydroxybutyrate depolymerase